jgi:hypothetical protein
MEQPLTTQELERLLVEIESLRAWYAELNQYLYDSLDDAQTTKEEFATTVVQTSRVLLRLKSLIVESQEVVNSPSSRTPVE